MSIEGGARAGLIAAGRDHVRLPRGPARRAGLLSRRRRALVALSHRRRRDLRPRGRRRRRRARARRSRGARTPARSCRSPDRCPSRTARPRSARSATWRCEAGTRDAGRRDRPRVHRLVHQRPPRATCAPRPMSCAGKHVAEQRAGDGRAGLDGGEGGGGGRGPRSRLRRRRLRVAQRRLLDVPRHEPRHPAAGGALRLDLATATSRAARDVAAAPI